MLLSKFFRKYKIYRQINEPSQTSPTELPISSNLESNISEIEKKLGAPSDLQIRRFFLGQNQQIQVALMFLDGLVDKDILKNNVMRPFMEAQIRPDEPVIAQILNSIMNVTIAQVETSMEKSIELLLQGKTLILFNGENKLIVMDARAASMRNVEEPVTESVVHGPREGFIENLGINLSLIRRKIQNPNLRVETYQIGQQTNTNIALVYVHGIVKEELVAEVRRRLTRIRIESVLDSGYIEQWIEDNPLSIFPTIAKSEKPDTIAGKILEGRVAILVDGSPVALMMPTVFIEFFQSVEDYYARPYYASLTRFLRYIAFFISTFLPALYIAFENFQKELIPPPLLVGFSQSREGVPFPLALEVLFMVIMFEWLREAGLRMPRPIGQAVSIVGALVVGEAAVNASMIGAPTVMIIAGAGITAFIIPELAEVSALLRILSIIVSSVLGLYGLFLLWYGIAVYLADVRSFGIPYLTPLAPMKFDEWKDFMIRFPLWRQNRRPDSLETVNQRKIGDTSPPHPPDKSSKGKQP